MSHLQNRILQAFRDWGDEQQELKRSFQGDIPGKDDLQLLKLGYFRRAQDRLKQIIRADEAPFMILIQREINKLEREAYPNLFTRIVMRLKDRWIDGPAHFQREKENRYANLNELTDQLRVTGFSYLAGKLGDHLTQGLQHVTIPIECQLDQSKRLSVHLHFPQNIHGNFVLQRISARLLDRKETLCAHSFELKEWPDIHAKQILNLLEGRAVKQNYINAEGNKAGRWVELNKEGMRLYHPEKLFDMHAVLDQIDGLKQNKAQIIRELENGNPVSAVITNGGITRSIGLQTDPANSSIKFSNSENPHVDPKELQISAQQRSAKRPLMNHGPLPGRKVPNRKHLKL